VLNLSEQELQEVARHMGHELSVHRQYYRLQDDIVELAKVSKVLIAVEKGFPGQSLDDIDLSGKTVSFLYYCLSQFKLKYSMYCYYYNNHQHLLIIS